MTINEIDSLNVNSGPALMAMNSWPESSKVTVSTIPDGVSWIVVTFVIRESSKIEV